MSEIDMLKIQSAEVRDARDPRLLLIHLTWRKARARKLLTMYSWLRAQQQLLLVMLAVESKNVNVLSHACALMSEVDPGDLKALLIAIIRLTLHALPASR